MRSLLRSVMVGLPAIAFATVAAGQDQLSLSHPSPSRSILDAPAHLDVRDVTLTKALTLLSERSGVVIAFSPTVLESDVRRVSCPCSEATVSQALGRILDGDRFTYSVTEGQVVLVPRSALVEPEPVLPLMLPFTRTVAALEPASSPSIEFQPPQDTLVIGTVIDRATRQAIVGAQVLVEGTQIGAVSDGQGRFLIRGITSPQVTLQVTRLGYRTTTQAVSAGDVGFQIAMASEIIGLDAVVVTGTAGGQVRRALGNSVVQVNASDLVALAPQVDVQNILKASAPGLAIQTAGGQVGSGSNIRVRGASSMALTSQPLVYIDGVRVDNSQAGGAAFMGAAGLGSTNFGGDTRYSASRINDINPEDIESIEIVKGPAAATLYGTEASNGVIQIITKKGQRGAPVLNMTVMQGANWYPNHGENLFSPAAYTRAADGEVVEVNILRHGREVGFPVSLYGYCPAPYEEVDGACRGGIFRMGHKQHYGGNVSGGLETVSYYFSSEWDRDEGMVSYNWQNRFSGRGNITWTPNEVFSLALGLGYIQSTKQSEAPISGITNALFAVCPVPGCEPGRNLPRGLDSPWRGYHFLLPERLENDMESFDRLNRTLVNANLTVRPLPWLTSRLVVGGDIGDQELTTLRDRLEGPFRQGTFFPNGMRSVMNRGMTYASADFSTTARFDVTPRVSGETSVGLQYYTKETREHWSFADQLAVAGGVLTDLSSGATRITGESFIPNKTAGVFVQQQASWDNRFFLIGALRADNNSAFGTEFDLVLYPKLSASWVVREGSSPDTPLSWLNSFRLRSAWGKAGMQPEAFVALQTYAARTAPFGTGLTTANFGNPNLEPEVATEIEGGFDAEFLEGQFGLELTGYVKRTTGAIVPAPIPPSTGFGGISLENLGEISNRGLEVAVHSSLQPTRTSALNLRSSLSLNRNRVESIGDNPTIPLRAAAGQYHVPGLPMGSLFARRVVSSDLVGGVATNVMCEGGAVIPGTPNLSSGGGAPVPCREAPEVFFGSTLPTWSGATSATLTLFNNLQIYAQADYTGGAWLLATEASYPHGAGGSSRAVHERKDPSLMGIVGNVAFDRRRQLGLTDMSYAAFRELSATYTLPASWAGQVGASRLTVTSSLHNLGYIWRKEPDKWGQKIPNPEARPNGASLFGTFDPGAMLASSQNAFPVMKRFLTTVRVTF